MQMTSEILSVSNLTKRFGNLVAVNDISFSVQAGSVVGLMGPNGSGKSTTFNLISGFLRPSGGRVVFDGKEITRRRPDQIAAKGLVRTFQLTSVFKEKTALENVVSGHFLEMGSPFMRPSWKGLDAVQENALSILEFVGLGPERDTIAALLPAGHQRVLSVATALACRPRLLLLDEPLAGLHPTEKRQVAAFIGKLKDKGLTILLVEHDVRSMMSVCDKLVVINFGAKISEGSPGHVANDQAVLDAYLGSGRKHAHD
jgi:branched-chain amino acid transport system ATP-binding protein